MEKLSRNGSSSEFSVQCWILDFSAFGRFPDGPWVSKDMLGSKVLLVADWSYSRYRKLARPLSSWMT